MKYVDLNKPSDYPLTTKWVEIPEKMYRNSLIPATTQPIFAWDCCGTTVAYIYGVMVLRDDPFKDILIRKLKNEVY